MSMNQIHIAIEVYDDVGMNLDYVCHISAWFTSAIHLWSQNWEQDEWHAIQKCVMPSFALI